MSTMAEKSSMVQASSMAFDDPRRESQATEPASPFSNRPALVKTETDNPPINHPFARVFDPAFGTQTGRNDGGIRRMETAEYHPEGEWVLRKSCLHRALERRHITGIAFSGTIGAGLFLNMSELIGTVGSPGAMLAYFTTGFIIIGVMRSLAEMVSVRPVAAPLIDFPDVFVDEALGFAVATVYCFAQCLSMALLTSAAARQVNNFVADGTLSVQTECGIIVALCLITVLSNLCGVRLYGELERIFKHFKLLLILGLCALMLAIKAGVGATDQPLPPHQKDFSFAPSFHPAGFAPLSGTGDSASLEVPGEAGQFLSMWICITIAMFPSMGGDLVLVASAEAKNPRRDLPAAARFMYLAPIILYVLASFCVGLNVNYMTPGFWNPWIAESTNAGSFSPFIIALQYTSIQALPGLLNACFMISAYTAGNTALYVASRTLFATARRWGNPRIKSTVGSTSNGHTPITAILLCATFSLLAFLGAAGTRDASFNQPILTLSSFFVGAVGCVYVTQCVSFLRFKQGLARLERDGIFSRDHPLYAKRYYRAHWQPVWAWIGLVGVSLIILFSGWPAIYIMVARRTLATDTLLKSNALLAADLIGAYSGPILFISVYVFFKLKWKTRLRSYEEVKYKYCLHEYEKDAANAFAPTGPRWLRVLKEIWSLVR